MSMEQIKDEDMGLVVGGIFIWHKDTMNLTYEHADGSKTLHKVLDFEKAWELSNQLHGKNLTEDEILNKLISNGYIEG